MRRHGQPALDKGPIDLEMELKTIGVFTVSKSLDGACRRARQAVDAWWQRYAVLVPLKDLLAWRKRRQYGIAQPSLGHLHVIPADFARRIARYLSAERLGQ